jgi:hypothetical protein
VRAHLERGGLSPCGAPTDRPQGPEGPGPRPSAIGGPRSRSVRTGRDRRCQRSPPL